MLVVAATAIAAGQADTVLVYRSRARGRQSSFGTHAHQGGRYWEKLPAELPGLNQWHVPHGLVSAFQEMAMIAMRHRIEFGTSDDHYADVAIAFREHAMRNPPASRSAADSTRTGSRAIPKSSGAISRIRWWSAP